MKILIAILVLAALAVGYLLIPSREDLERRNRRIDEHRADIDQALADCTEIHRELSRYKSTQRLKTELQEVRQRYLGLDAEAERFLEDSAFPRDEARTGLEQLEPRYYDLKRDSEDLRARLRVLREKYLEYSVLVGRTGRLQRELLALKAESTDLAFNQRVDELLEESKRFRSFAEQGLVRIASSIVEGRPIAEAAIAELAGLEERMTELCESRQEKAGPN